MKIREAALSLLLAVLLSGCASSEPRTEGTGQTPETSAPETTEPVVTPSQEPEDTPPATLEDALAAAKQDHSDVIDAVGAMEDLYRQAQVSLQPRMTADEWNKLDLVRMHTSVGALNESMSEAEVIAGVQEYAARMHSVALRLGAI